MIRLKLITLAALLFLVCATAYGQTIYVHQGDNLQLLINQAPRGATLVLDAGATFTGPITLPPKAGTGYVTIQSSGVSSLPEGRRVKPTDEQYMATIVSPPLQPALKTDPGASFYKLIGLEFTIPNQDGLPEDQDLTTYAIVEFGSPAYTAATDLPGNLILDRCYIHAWPTREVKRGVEIHSKETSITNCYISEIHWTGESQAIGGWNGPGPYHIINNYLESSGPNIIFGGAPPNIQNMIADGVEVRRNHLYKQPSWHPDPAVKYCVGNKWMIKGLFELKSAKNVTVEGNIMEYSWGCMGYGAINLTVRNDSPPGENKNSWATVQNVTIKNNKLRHMLTGVNILGLDYNGQPSVQGHDIVFDNNLFEDIHGRWGEGDTGTWIRIRGMNNVTFNHNTALGSDYGLMVMSDSVVVGSKMTGFVMKNNIASYGFNGFAGFVPANSPQATWTRGEDALKEHLANPPLPPIHHNVFIGGDSGLYTNYAEANYWPATIAAVGFENYDGHNYRLADNTAYENKSDDSPAKDIGVDFDELDAATAGVIEGTPAAPPGSNSLSLNGTSAYAQAPNTQSLTVTGAITVEAWVKYNPNGSYQVIVAKDALGQAGGGGGYQLSITNTGKPRFNVWIDHSTSVPVVGLTTVTAGVWHHIAGVADGTERRIYLDGVLDGSEPGAQLPAAGTGALNIGRRGNNTFRFSGLIDEVRVSGAALSTSNFTPETGPWAAAETRGLWKFNGQTANDFSPNANNATLQGGADYSPDVPVAGRYSLLLNGTNASAQAPDSDSLDLANSAITVEAWVKYNLNGNYQVIVAKDALGQAGGGGGYQLSIINTGKPRFNVWIDHSTSVPVVGITTLSPGVWHHVAGVADGSQRRVYLDGVLDGSEPGAQLPTAGTGALNIGRRGNNTFRFSGRVDEVRVSGAALYNSNFTPAKSLTLGASTKGLWKFDFQAAADDSGNGNQATLQGGAVFSTDVP